MRFRKIVAATSPALDLPGPYDAADNNSLKAQRFFLWLRRSQLTLLVVAAVGSALPLRVNGGGPDWAGVVAVVAFVLAAFAELAVLNLRPDRTWFDGRAVAESIKTLAWRYSVGGDPFGLAGPDVEKADALLVGRIDEVIKEFPGRALVPAREAGEYITESMRATRGKSLAERKGLYRQSRIDDQRRWYAGKAKSNDSLAQKWGFAIIAIQGIGALGALFKALGIFELDLLAVVSAIAASALAWLQIKQHSVLAESYSLAAHELSAVVALIDKYDTEATWASFVDEAEKAISREHTAWKALRGSRP
jgi:hypothetical protein